MAEVEPQLENVVQPAQFTQISTRGSPALEKTHREGYKKYPVTEGHAWDRTSLGSQVEVYWYTFKQPDKRRPLILTRTSAISPHIYYRSTTYHSNSRHPTEVILLLTME